MRLEELASFFPQPCSVYAHAKDAHGEYFDPETGEIIHTMTVGDFLFNPLWEERVKKLRKMVEEMGVAMAKIASEYRQIKQSLPGATLSGLFSLYEDESRYDPQQTVLVSRRITHLHQHTGFIVLDIDLGDNANISDFESVKTILRDRPEVAVIMRSCSGTGFLGLARIAYPEHHKQQCAALMKDYRYLGIKLDKSCSDVTRLRFATWDDDPYVNPHAVPYKGIDLGEEVLPSQHSACNYTARSTSYYQSTSNYQSGEISVETMERWVSEVERQGKDLTVTYADWRDIGYSLREFGECGRVWFHRLSALNPKYKPAETDKMWAGLGTARVISWRLFISRCEKAGIRPSKTIK